MFRKKKTIMTEVEIREFFEQTQSDYDTSGDKCDFDSDQRLKRRICHWKILSTIKLGIGVIFKTALVRKCANFAVANRKLYHFVLNVRLIYVIQQQINVFTSSIIKNKSKLTNYLNKMVLFKI